MTDKVLIQSRITRIFHWSFSLCIVILLTSGFYIHNPINLGVYNMKNNVLLQTLFGILAAGIFIAWAYYQIVTQSYKNILVKSRDFADFIGLLKYYFFLEKKPPVHGKYNAGQRIIYTSWIIVFLFMLITGSILYAANFGYVFPIPVMIQKIRLYHFLGSLWFLSTVLLHIYLVFTEDPAKLQAMFTGWVKGPQKH